MTKGYLSEIFVSFQGEGLHVGRRQLFLRMAGCHLRCRYCDTPNSLERHSTFRVQTGPGSAIDGSNPLTCNETLALALPLIQKSSRCDGTAITGGEPLLQAEFLSDLLSDERWPRPRMLETSGTLPEKLAALLAVVDVVSMDLKLPSNTGEGPLWEAHRRCLEIAGGKAYVKILVDDDTLAEDVRCAAELIRDVAPRSAVFLQPITDPVGRVALSSPSLDLFFGIARETIADVRVVPQTHKMLSIP